MSAERGEAVKIEQGKVHFVRSYGDFGGNSIGHVRTFCGLRHTIYEPTKHTATCKKCIQCRRVSPKGAGGRP